MYKTSGSRCVIAVFFAWLVTCESVEWNAAEHWSLNRSESENIEITGARLCQDLLDLEPHDFQSDQECCVEIETRYHKDWSSGWADLTSHLATVSVLSCPELHTECQERHFAVGEFPSLVYDLFCETEALLEKCTLKVKEAIKDADEGSGEVDFHRPTFKRLRSRNTNRTERVAALEEWIRLSGQLRMKKLPGKWASEPCVQMAQFDPTDSENYHELVFTDIPFCEVVWCGFDTSVTNHKDISAWTCMSPRCKINVNIIMAVCVILAITITLVNLLVILVIALRPSLQHSQFIYQFCLAVSDLLVGALVLPSTVLGLIRLSSPHFDRHSSLEEELFLNDKDCQESHYWIGYRNVVGFFTTLCLVVSLYTILFAAMDRFIAITMPLAYRQHTAKKLAKVCCLLVWLFGLALASLPFYAQSLRYDQVVSVLVLMRGDPAWLVCIVALLLPLVLIWLVSIGTFVNTKRHTRKQSQLTKHSNSRLVEYRLAQTLSIMVGVLTINVLPATITLFYLLSCSRSGEDLEERIMYRDAQVLAALFLLSNSIWNFFIYAGRSKDFRAAVRSLLASLLDKLGISSFLERVRSSRLVSMATARRRASAKYVNRGWISPCGNSAAPSSGSGEFGFEFDRSLSRLSYLERDARLEIDFSGAEEWPDSFHFAGNTDLFKSVMRKVDQIHFDKSQSK